MKIGNIDVKWQTVLYVVLALAGQLFGLLDQHTTLFDHAADQVTTIGESFGMATILKEIIAHWVEHK